MHPPKRYPTTVRDVTELRLTGFADARPWRERLRAEALTPYESDGRVELTLLACATKYKGIAFRELSLSVRLKDDAAFLVAAMNSVRFFAWVERVVFKTPYRHGDVHVSATEMRAADRDGLCVRAAMGGPMGPSAAPGDEGWEGPIFLPGKKKLFFGKLVGASRTRPFGPSDTFSCAPRPPFALVDGFLPQAWHVRTGAVHSRSKSVRRPG